MKLSEQTAGLERIGWTAAWAKAFSALDPGDALAPARVAEEHRGVLSLLWAGGELLADVSGRLRYLAIGAEELPGVGDWVSVEARPGEGRGTVHHVLPRHTALVRKAPERPAEAQLLVANVDSVFIMTSANRDFRPRRVERTLALVREGGAEPVVVVSKRDLADSLDGRLTEAAAAAAGCPVRAISALTGEGLDGLSPFVGPGLSVALIGSSGVGKSTLVNRLVGRELLDTADIRETDDKGRHTTTHRQLVALPAGGVLVDTPGLREIGLWDDEGGVDSAFPDVEALIADCRFGDCGHGSEPGCAVREALEQGRLDPGRFQSYAKLKREAARIRDRRSGRARHEQRQSAKRFAKLIRSRQDKRRPR